MLIAALVFTTANFSTGKRKTPEASYSFVKVAWTPNLRFWKRQPDKFSAMFFNQRTSFIENSGYALALALESETSVCLLARKLQFRM